MPMAMIAMWARLGDDVDEVAGRQEPVGERAEHGEQDQEQEQRRVLQRQHAQAVAASGLTRRLP